MLLQKVSVAIGLFVLASASVVVKRQGTTVPIPDACTSQCTILTTLTSVSSAQDVAPLCTSDTEQSIITCYQCIETNAPGEITQQGSTITQTVADNLVSACAALGSPIPSFSIPGATGTTMLNTEPTTDATFSSLLGDLSSLSLTNGGPTVAPITSGTGSAGAPAPSSTSTTSHSGAMTLLLPQTFGVASLVVALTAIMVV